eukprot:scaffold524523_cov47-Prasinocladus_malaysianus.AAC.1
MEANEKLTASNKPSYRPLKKRLASEMLYTSSSAPAADGRQTAFVPTSNMVTQLGSLGASNHHNDDLKRALKRLRPTMQMHYASTCKLRHQMESFTRVQHRLWQEMQAQSQWMCKMFQDIQSKMGADHPQSIMPRHQQSTPSNLQSIDFKISSSWSSAYETWLSSCNGSAMASMWPAANAA